jgi:FixJ family two-component response regulator
MKDKPKILIIEDSNKESDLEIKFIKKAIPVCEFKIVDNEVDFLKQLHSYLPDVIISDLKLRKWKGMDALKLSLNISPSTPFIFVARIKETETAVKCIRAGATDFITKENMGKLGRAVLQAIGETGIRQQETDIREETKDNGEETKDNGKETEGINDIENGEVKDLLINILKHSGVLSEKILDEELNYCAEAITGDCKKIAEILNITVVDLSINAEKDKTESTEEVWYDKTINK